MRKSWRDCAREWLDTFVVAISVAMAFRAYFFEPFNIPTGSMMPTLYGNHSEECKEPGVFETTPLKWFNWLLTGRDYKEFKAPFDGRIVAQPRMDGRADFAVMSASTGRVSDPVTLPVDALSRVNPGAYVRAGSVLWRGYDTTGDFIFVNRWRWNFRAPARGEVMVFSTNGIRDLDQGTHYIKRLTALPGETIQIVKPDVFIDGERIEPLKPMTGARGERTPEPNDGGEVGMKGPVKLGEGEYFACGDNSDNSKDSRYWGPVPERNLTGTGSFVFWPIINPRWGAIK